MNIDTKLQEMRETAEAMRGGPAKGVLLKWALMLENALKADRAQPPQEPPKLHGMFDNLQSGYRELYADGHLQQAMRKEGCPSNRPWQRYPDVPR